jgi:hypothetical protein
MRRTAFGLLGVVSFLVGALLYLFGPSRDPYIAFAGGGVRVGLVLGAIWLAYPQLVRIPWWFVQIGLVGALLVAVRPKFAAVVLPLLIALWLLRPRPPKSTKTAKRRPPSRQSMRGKK